MNRRDQWIRTGCIERWQRQHNIIVNSWSSELPFQQRVEGMDWLQDNRKPISVLSAKWTWCLSLRSGLNCCSVYLPPVASRHRRKVCGVYYTQLCVRFCVREHVIKSHSQSCFGRGWNWHQDSGKCDGSRDESVWRLTSLTNAIKKGSCYVKVGLVRWSESLSYILSVSVNQRWYSIGPELSRVLLSLYISTWMLRSAPWPECSKWTCTDEERLPFSQ